MGFTAERPAAIFLQQGFNALFTVYFQFSNAGFMAIRAFNFGLGKARGCPYLGRAVLL